MARNTKRSRAGYDIYVRAYKPDYVGSVKLTRDAVIADTFFAKITGQVNENVFSGNIKGVDTLITLQTPDLVDEILIDWYIMWDDNYYRVIDKNITIIDERGRYDTVFTVRRTIL